MSNYKIFPLTYDSDFFYWKEDNIMFIVLKCKKTHFLNKIFIKKILTYKLF
jgi:hypothetical protein